MSSDSNATPAFFVDKITDIVPGHLKNMGVAAVLVDLDNTTVYDSTFRLLPGVRAWVKAVRAAGIQVIILTNTFTFRARILARKLGHLPYIALAKKPDVSGFKKAQEMAAVPAGKIAMIGDRLFADIEGANRAGMISIKVRITKKEVLFARKNKKIRRREHNYLRKRGFGSDL